MGKDKKSKSSKKEVIAVCNCTDPNKCLCGKRPDTPSKNHKWDSETQCWGGKGHKQKGASGQVAAIAKKSIITAVGQTQIEQWQRQPSEILEEFCKREKRRSPNYQPTLLPLDRVMFKYQVFLPDPKNKKKDLLFEPLDAVENEEQAREEAALLALIQLTPNIPHERKLPEPYRTTWLHAVARKNEKCGEFAIHDVRNANRIHSPLTKLDNSTKNPVELPSVTFSTAAQANSNLTLATIISNQEDCQRLLNIGQLKQHDIRQQEAIRMANRIPKVVMCASIRNQIRMLLHSNTSIDWEDDISVQETGNEDDATGTVKIYVERRLMALGFSKKQARTAFQNTPDKSLSRSNIAGGDCEAQYEKCLQWLLCYLGENELPEGFDARAGTLEVITSTKSLSDPGDLDLACRYGLILVEASRIRKDVALSRIDRLSVEEIVWNMMRETAFEIASANNSVIELPLLADCSKKDNDVQLQEELVAIESIFALYSLTRSSGITTVSIQLPRFGKSLLLVLEDGNYPSRHPSRVFILGGWKADGTGAACQVQLIKFVLSLDLGEEMIFRIYSEALSLLQSVAGDDVTPLSLFPVNNLKSATNLCLSSKFDRQNYLPPLANPNRKLHFASANIRNRKHATFWTVAPEKTPPANPFPKVDECLQSTRNALPAAAARSKFLALMHQASSAGRVIVVSGDTGCGKSTQIPQFLLEDSPSTAKIVVCQPRRLAAASVATRVAIERGETQPGIDSVGYVVRGDSAISKRSRLVFCTTGVLLRQLQTENSLCCLTHIIIDEVHERHLDTDVLLALLRQLLPQNPRLNVILMSATMEVDRLSAYWGIDTPSIDIPGRTFSIKDYMLEDVLSILQFVPPRNGKKASQSVSVKIEADDVLLRSTNKEVGNDRLIKGISISELVKRIDETVIQYEIIARLIEHLICDKAMHDNGSILVFLPGVAEINEAMQAIKLYEKDLQVVVIPLHGGVNPKEQSQVFTSAPKGITKVILATNICQTSITIPDCTVVIDTAKENQSLYDPTNRMPHLVEKFASKVDLKQRRGRAGRVREGICYKLISNATFDRLDEHGAPEIMRSALDQTLLMLLFMGVEDGSGDFINTLLDPPTKESLDAAFFSLTKIGAVDSRNGVIGLTPLGKHLSGIPAPPTVGKLVVMGAILGCRSASISIAAGISLDKNPFLHIGNIKSEQNGDEGESNEVLKSRLVVRERAQLLKAVGNSDHALLGEVFRQWELSGNRKLLCEKLGLNFVLMGEMSQLARRLDAALVSIGFTKSEASDQNSASWRLVRACVVSAMSPNQLIKVVRPAAKYDETLEGARQKDGIASDIKFFIRTENTNEEPVFIHPSSFLFSNGIFSFPWLVYHNLVRTSKPFVRDITECSAYSLLLFGGHLDIKLLLEEAEVVVDGWAKLNANPTICSLVGSLRELVDELLSRKVSDPSVDVVGSAVVKIIVKLIQGDGYC